MKLEALGLILWLRGSKSSGLINVLETCQISNYTYQNLKIIYRKESKTNKPSSAFSDYALDTIKPHWK